MANKGISQDIAAALPELPVVQITGSHDAGGLHFGIVASRFNGELVQALLGSAVEALIRAGADPAHIVVHWVPGAYESPLVAQRLAASGYYHAVIVLGCVIEGETSHAEVITNEVARSLSEIARDFDLPIIDGVVSTRNLAQAETRCQGGETSRGWYAALAAVEMAALSELMSED